MSADDGRRRFLRAAAATLGSAWLAGCDRIASSESLAGVLQIPERLNYRLQRLLTGRLALAQEFTEAERSPSFRSNGTSEPDDAQYRAMAAAQFADYRLQVTGLVERSLSLSLDEVRALPSRTQITRHDCVEGWSAIAKWKGALLSALLERAGVKPEARYVMFYCADPMEDDADSKYYESIDLVDAHHPQTILAYELNDESLPVGNGAPLRARIERQLGYKMAKYIMRIELVASFENIRGGKGGYWEDQGYEWYAGI